MKKSYKKPTMCVVPIKYPSYLLAGSPLKGKIDDNENYENWDFDGGQ